MPMRIDRKLLNAIAGLDIEEVAGKLDIEVVRHKAICFVHGDKHPSLSFSPAKRIWKCFSCGAKGDVVGLVMTKNGLDYAEAVQWLAEQYKLSPGGISTGISFRNRESMNFKPLVMNEKNTKVLPMQWVERFRSNNSVLLTGLIQQHILTSDQAFAAAELYRLGCTKNRRVVFWLIDQDGQVHDGKVMSYEADAHRSHSVKPDWIVPMMKRIRNSSTGEPYLPADWSSAKCLFGLHLLRTRPQASIAVVESEKTALICSQLLAGKDVLWMACGGLASLSAEKLAPLKGRQVILFPDTDTTGKTFILWKAHAQEFQKQLGFPLPVSDILEKFATHQQKERKIDIADFLYENAVFGR